jgi:phospholipid N-methyltransferase
MRDKVVIVELGAGTGAFTEMILAKMPKNGTLLAFETNHILTEHLRKTLIDPRLFIIEDDAARLYKHLEEHSLPPADCIVSGLPFGDFNRAKRQRLLSAIRDGLGDGGLYLQFQYLPVSLQHIKKMFRAKIIGFEMRNFPPAFLYECKKK